MLSSRIYVLNMTQQDTPNGRVSNVHFMGKDGRQHRFIYNGTIFDAMLARFTVDPSGWYSIMNAYRRTRPLSGY